MIIEKCEIIDLISLAETNKHLQFLVKNVFRRLYSSRTIQFVTPFRVQTGTTYEAEEQYNQIFIDTYETAIKVLKHFGPLIGSIKLDMTRFDDKFISLNNLISYQCADTLKSLEFNTHDNGVFDHFVKPFAVLETLTLYGGFQSLHSDALNDVDLFPTLCSITLINVDFKDKTCIDRNFPHLEKAYIDIHHSAHRLNKESVAKLIKKNPQIKQLQLIHPMISLLNHIAEDLHQLESLELVFYQEIDLNFVEYDIHFDSVKRLKMSGGFFSMPINTTFGNLVEFETDAKPDYCQRWMEFIEQSNCLEIIRLNDRHLSRDEFTRLTNANVNLMAFYPKCETNINIENIFEFIERNNNLRMMHLEFDIDDAEFFNKTVQQLQEKLVDHQNDPIWSVKRELLTIKLELFD